MGIDKGCGMNWRKRTEGKYLTMWRDLTGWRLFAFYTLHYTVLFALLSLFVFHWFSAPGKNFIWNVDGLSQHIPRLVYISQTLRNGIKALLAGNGWQIPLYDFHVGLVAQDLQIGFPQILAIFFSRDKIGLFYNWYVLGIYYFAGLSFSLLGFFFRQKVMPVLIGTVSYTFCGYLLFAAVRHPHFGFPMFILPLLIVGIEQVFQKKRSYLLLFSVFLSLTAQWGLYFSCIQVVFCGIYVLVRFFDVYKKDRFHEFLRLCGRLAMWGGTGVLLAAFVAIPAWNLISGTGRVGAHVWNYFNVFHYSNDYYAKTLMYFLLIPKSAGSWNFRGFSVLTLPAVLLLFFRKRRRERSLRVIFLILTFMLMIPAVAYVMSGFSNITNRFSFGYALCVSAILMFMVPHFAALNRSMAAFLSLSLLFYFAVCYFVAGNVGKIYQNEPFVLLFISVLSLFCCYGIQKKRLATMAVCLTITCFSVCYTAFLLYAPDKGNYVREFATEPYRAMRQEQYAALSQSRKLSEDKSFYRVLGNKIRRSDAQFPFYYGLNGLSMYPYYGWSSAYMDWIREMEVARTAGANKHQLYGLDSRASLLTLADVKYYAYKKPDTAVPYGFFEIDRVGKGENTNVILKNRHWAPLGYTYDNYLSRNKYEKLNPLEKQEALLQSAVLEDLPLQLSIKEKEPAVTARKIPWKIKSMKDLTWQNGRLTVKKEKATMTLEFTGAMATETYLRIVNLDPTDGARERWWDLQAVAGNAAAEAVFHSDAHVYSNGQKKQLLNMGYFPNGCSSITITFPSKGICTLDDLEVWCQPMDSYAAQVDALREEVLENIKTNWRGLTGNITVSKDKILCIAIPWLDGWKAYVDGRETKLYRANTAFMAVELPAGTHEVELRYWMPGLTVGLILSGIGVFCLIALTVYSRRRAEE